MAVHGSRFIYNKRSSDEFGVMMATIGTPESSQNLGMSREIIRDRPINSSVDIIHGSHYSGNLEFPITLVKKNGSRFTNDNIRQLNRWLIGYSHPKKLEIDSDILGVDNTYFNCLFTSVSTTSHAGIIALTYNVYCDAPYGWEDFNVTYEINTTQATQIEFFNTSDEMEEYLYPSIKITKIGDGDITISSEHDSDNDVILKDLVDGEVVTIDNLNQIISSTKQTFTNTLGGYDNFNHNWLRFLPDSNILNVYGGCILELSGRYVRKVGI
jgi:phage-related protein